MGLVSAAKKGELNDWRKFKIYRPLKGLTPSKSIVDARWATSQKMVDGEKDVEARLVAEEYQGPDLRGGSVDASGRVSLCSSHLEAIFLGSSKK